MKLTTDDYVELFKNNIVRLLYVNKEGEESERRVTLIESHITWKASANPNKKRAAPKNEGTVVVWDLDKNMWRRLYIENIIIVRGIESAIPDEQAGQ